MWRKIANVGGLTLLSRLFGFVRDVIMAAVLGAGPLADAFMVAFRLPNHFRTIFAEGAFNAAFVPRYAAALVRDGPAGARNFAENVLGLTLLVQAVLLVVALLFAPAMVAVLAPGFTEEPGQVALTAELLRATFPYLLLISAMTLLAGMLAGHDRFAAAAAAPILLNICLIAALLSASLFKTPAHALAWGVLAAGFAQLALVLADFLWAGLRMSLTWPRLTAEVRDFLRGFGPAVLGAAGPQIGMLADTIIASMLPSGSVSFLYYADRLYQLPVAVIGLAIGTVLLPELSRRIAAKDDSGALIRLNRALDGSMLLTLPFVALFLVAAEPVIALLFGRGAFGADAIAGSAMALTSYAVGLPAVIALRSVVSAFYARGDTATPVKALAIATIVNVGLKLVLVGPLAVAGLALATAVAAWVNFCILVFLLKRADRFQPDRRSTQALGTAVVAFAAALAAFIVAGMFTPMAHGLVPALPDLAPVVLLVAAGWGAYVLVAAAGVLVFRLR
jgi:putative peptidoglycan lipid II flippase